MQLKHRLPQLVFLVSLITSVATIGWAQAPDTTQCQPPDSDVAVYDFVPEQPLQTGEFRPLMKTEQGFLATLRDASAFNVSDYTTSILPPEIMPEPPQITGELTPPPAEIPILYFITGTITKSSGAFLLTTELRKPDTGAVLHTAETPFASAAEAEAAGVKSATQILAFIASQNQSSRQMRESGDHAINPRIDLIIDKLLLKPEEVSKVKVVLSDCDGVRLKHRPIEAQLQFTSGGAVVDADTLERITDENGERNGDIGAHKPGVINYIVKFKYKDMMGNVREVTDARTIVVSGGEGGDLWQLRVDINEEDNHLFFKRDQQSGRFDSDRYFLKKQVSMVFLFKVKTNPEGDVFTNEPTAFNGYGQATFFRKSIEANDSATIRSAQGMLDHTTPVSELLPSFSVDLANKTFTASLQTAVFRGPQQTRSFVRHPYRTKTATNDWDAQIGADGSTPITPEMVRSGDFKFTVTTKSPCTSANNTGFELKTFTFEAKRMGPPTRGMIKR